MRIPAGAGRALVALWTVLATVSSSPLREFTVCVAADGHWSLEILCVGRACDPHGEEHGPPGGGPEVARPAPDGQPCRDLAAVHPADGGVRDPGARGDLASAGAVHVAAPGGGAAAIASRVAAGEPHATTASLLRSVVLIA